jgi:general secretion pathway protein C
MTIAPRYFVLAHLLLLAAIAYAASSVVGTAIAAKLAPPPVVHISEPPPPLARAARKPDSYYALIDTRDIFNSAKPEPEKPKGPPPKTELKVKLWGIAIHEDGKSSCVIEDLTTRRQELYHVGDTVQGIATIARVEWDRVVLDRDGKEEVLELSTELRPPSMMTRGPINASRSIDEHIQLVGDNTYQIDRSEVDGALQNMSQLFTQVRAVPHFEGGRSTGFRLFAIRQNSLFDKIGLKNGDIIQSINGVPLTDPSRALALFQELRNENQLTVDLVRNREPKTLSYQFR